MGTAAFWEVTQAQADAAMEQVIAAGVNHIDVAPSYGLAEERLGPWLARERDRRGISYPEGRRIWTSPLI